jgi:Integrase core domain
MGGLRTAPTLRVDIASDEYRSFKAVAELKRERIRRRTYKTRAEARQDVFDYVEMSYNPKRKHARQREMKTEASRKLGAIHISNRWLRKSKPLKVGTR